MDDVESSEEEEEEDEKVCELSHSFCYFKEIFTFGAEISYAVKCSQMILTDVGRPDLYL